MTDSNEKSPVIEIWDIEKLIPYEMNAKQHPEDQVRKLATAISKFGWTQPIVVWKNGEIIAGHGRRLAAISLGLKKVPVVVRSDLSKAEADALRLADNKVTSTTYDEMMVQDELIRIQDELEGMNILLTDLGYDQKEIDFAMANLGEINESALLDDFGSAVEDQRAENENHADEIDQSAAPVGDALGFKRVTVMQSREIRGYMAQVEEATSSNGPEALLKFFRQHLGKASA